MHATIMNDGKGCQVHPVTGNRFGKYGRVVEGIDFVPALSCLEASTPIPQAGVYVASFPELEALSLRGAVAERVFGAMDVQLGYCNGMTGGLDALEYHKGSEVIVADSDVILLLSSVSSLSDGHLSADAVEAFLLPAGIPVELYAGTLHFAPCRTSARGYRSLVVLPAGTNLPLPPDFTRGETGESRLVFARNKWLIARPDCVRLIARGAFPGLDGAAFECVEAAP